MDDFDGHDADNEVLADVGHHQEGSLCHWRFHCALLQEGSWIATWKARVSESKGTNIALVSRKNDESIGYYHQLNVLCSKPINWL